MNAYDELFEAYVVEMREGMSRALAWWEEILAHEIKLVGQVDEAKLRVNRRWPFGPASHPYVIAIYRKYCLACDRINEDLKSHSTNHPEEVELNETDWGTEEQDNLGNRSGPISCWVLLIDGLRGKHNDLAEFLSGLVFSPIGTDPASGNFV